MVLLEVLKQLNTSIVKWDHMFVPGESAQLFFRMQIVLTGSDTQYMHIQLFEIQ